MAASPFAARYLWNTGQGYAKVENKPCEAFGFYLGETHPANFAAKAGETGKLYGSITTQDLVSAIKAKSGIEIKKQQVDMQPLRTLGEHKAHVRLTMDLIPEVRIQVFREGEAEPGPQPEGVAVPAKPEAEEKAVKAAAEA